MEYIERMEQELSELVERGEKLDEWLCTMQDEISREESDLMYRQLYHMNNYAIVLDKRIELATKIHKKDI